MPLTVRTAAAEDAPAIVELVERAFRGDSSRRGWTTEADMLGGQRTDHEAVLASISSPHERFLLAFDGQALVASVLVRDEGAGTAYLGMLAVEPGLQGQGSGRALVAEAERAAAEAGASVMRMTVIAQRPELIAWYERLGYARTGEREPFPYGNPRYGIPRRDDLYFVVLKKALRDR